MIDRQSQLIAASYAGAKGQLPGHGDRLPNIRVRQVRARVLSNTFFWRNRERPKVGEIIVGDHDDIVGLARRSLVELVP